MDFSRNDHKMAINGSIWLKVAVFALNILTYSKFVGKSTKNDLRFFLGDLKCNHPEVDVLQED